MAMKMVTEMSTQLKWKSQSKLKHQLLPLKAMKILLKKKIVKMIRQRRTVVLLLVINPNRNTTGTEDLHSFFQTQILKN